MSERYDSIVVGSGAGGAAAAYRLARAGKRVLVLEKGEALPRDGSTLDVQKVIHQGAFKSRETWLDKDGAEFAPEEYFNLGGKTKWYGAALARFAPEEFEADPVHQCREWPIVYADLAPYYEEAERLLNVRRFDAEPGLSAIVARLARGGIWRSEPLPLALAAAILDHPEEARHFDAFAYGFFLQTEDGSSPDNRVVAGRGGEPPCLDYDPERIRPSLDEHRRLVRGFVGALWRSGYAAFSRRIPLAGTAHAVGSLVAGRDPSTSVVDAEGRVHGMENLYLVDGSILPRSSRVNPSLTIYTWALRVAERLVRRQREQSHAEHEETALA